VIQSASPAALAGQLDHHQTSTGIEVANFIEKVRRTGRAD
jgi:hypothetical protein